jgi:hypothetical protein
LNIITFTLSFTDADDLKEISDNYASYSESACNFAFEEEFKDLFGSSP